jgi:hypothetical protein
MATPNITAQESANITYETAIDTSNSVTETDTFFAIDGNDKFRPYCSALIENNTNTATIVLLEKPNPPSSTTNEKDYFSDYSTTISLSDVEASSVGTVPELPEVRGGAKNKYYGIFKNFSLLNYQEGRNEIAKVNLNFSLKWNAYFFGSQPRIYSFSGVFIDSKNYPYYEEFMEAYDSYLSGGNCLSNGFRLYLAYDGKIIAGWMLGIQITASSEQRFGKGFTFSVLVDSETWIRENYQYDSDGTTLTDNGSGLSNEYRLKSFSKKI